jgi:hypothetical protein
MATPNTSPERPRPAVDEWGLYDPEQAGLSALFVKLADTTRRTRQEGLSDAAREKGADSSPAGAR